MVENEQGAEVHLRSHDLKADVRASATPSANFPVRWQVLFHHPSAQNFAWLVGDRVFRLAITMLVGSWIIRHLGEQQFGLFSYVGAWMVIVSGASSLGMDAFAVRDLARGQEKAGWLLGTVIGFRVSASVVGVLSVLALLRTAHPSQPIIWALVALFGIGIICQSLESAELWFVAQTQMQRLILPRFGLLVVGNAVKLLVVLNGGGLVEFVAVNALEMAAGGALTIVMVRYGARGVGKLRFDGRKGWSMLRECWPLALSSLVVIVYMRIAQLLLAGLLGNSALGIYSAAVRISEAANFLPVMLASSLLPSLLRKRDVSPESYRLARLQFFRLNAIVAYVVCVPLAVASSWIVKVLYGGQFAESAPILTVHAWTLLFVFMGVSRAQHFLNERQSHWPLRLTIWGLLVNVLLNLLLIPRYGPLGAAYAVLVANAISAVGTSFLFASTRQIGWEQLYALATPWRALTQRS